MSVTSFLWPLVASVGCVGAGLPLAVEGAGLQAPAVGPLGGQAGLSAWAQMGHLPVPSLCQEARSSTAPTSWPPPAPSPQAGEGSDV